MSTRVVLLTSAGDHQRFIANRLAAELNLVGLLIEDRSFGAPLPQGLGARLEAGAPRLHRFLLTIKRGLTVPKRERQAKALLERLERVARDRFVAGHAHEIVAWPEGPAHKVVKSVNLPSSVSWCSELSPDIVLVYGTRILKSPMIRVAELGTLNAHSSLLPSYRGTSSEFWQVLEARLDCAGVTVHYIDEGVDTGDILIQESSLALLSRTDPDPFELRVANVELTAKLFVEAVRGLEAGTLERRPQPPSSGPTYRYKDRTLEKQIELAETLHGRE